MLVVVVLLGKYLTGNPPPPDAYTNQIILDNIDQFKFDW